MGRAKSEAIRFIDHVQELRRRLVWVALMLIAGSAIGYALLDTLIGLLSKPFGQKLYYSAPTGQFTFIIKVCILFGVVVAAPTIIYHAAKFLEPLFRIKTKRRILRYTLAAVIMAASGVLFAYFLSLPLTLQFLTGEQESTAGIIAPLISADEYFNFVIAYIAGFAILFQVPLVVLIINSIKPLDPGNFVGSIRYVVLISFIVSAIITPTPDPMNQAIMAGPVIVLYAASYLIIIVSRLFSRNKKPARHTADGLVAVIRLPEPRKIARPATITDALSEIIVTERQLGAAVTQAATLPAEQIQVTSKPTPSVAQQPTRMIDGFMRPSRPPVTRAAQPAVRKVAVQSNNTPQIMTPRFGAELRPAT